MKPIVIILALIFSQTVLGVDVRTLYMEKFSASNTGVYEDNGFLYFVVKQQCLSDKKYSGTDESKAAELLFYEMLANELRQRNVSFNQSSIEFDGALREDVFNNISKKYDAKSLVRHQLLFDRDAGHCVREYVQVSDAKQFEKNQIKIPLSDIEKSKIELLSQALTENNYSLLSSYFTSLNLNQLSSIYREVDKQFVYPFGIRFGDDLNRFNSYCAEEVKYCSSELAVLSQYDFNAVLSKVFNEKGVVNAISLYDNQYVSDHYYLKAKSNFDKGIYPEKIVSYLTVAINLQPSNKEAWKMLASIYRATGEYTLSLYASSQYILLTPSSVDSWVHLMKSLALTNKTQADKLHELLVAITKNTNVSPWANEQIKEYL